MPSHKLLENATMMRYVLAKIVESQILTTLCAFTAIGIIGLIYDFCLLKQRKRFGKKYLLKYKQLVDSGPSEKKHYQWLLRNVDKMEYQMGEYGLIGYRPPFANYQIQNYAALSNTLLNIRTPAAVDLAGTQALLERYIGARDNQIAKKWKEIFNPLIWLTRAVRLILLDGPLWIFRSVGLMSGNTENKIRNYSLVNPIIGTITLLGSLASIVSGWNSLVKFLSQIFGWLRSIGVD